MFRNAPRLISLLIMRNFFLTLARCFSAVRREVFKRLAISLLVRPFFTILQISLDCIDKLVKCIAKFNIGEIDADTSLKISKQILEDEIDDPEFLEFAIEYYSEMFGYINTGRINIRTHRDIEGEMRVGVG